MPLTQLHPGAISGRRYGTFVGKEDGSGGGGPHPVNRLTQLHPGVVSGQRYGSFVKGVIPPEPEEEQVGLFGRKRRKKKPKRDIGAPRPKKELMVSLVMMTAMLDDDYP